MDFQYKNNVNCINVINEWYEPIGGITSNDWKNGSEWFVAPTKGITESFSKDYLNGKEIDNEKVHR